MSTSNLTLQMYKDRLYSDDTHAVDEFELEVHNILKDNYLTSEGKVQFLETLEFHNWSQSGDRSADLLYSNKDTKEEK